MVTFAFVLVVTGLIVERFLATVVYARFEQQTIVTVSGGQALLRPVVKVASELSLYGFGENAQTFRYRYITNAAM